MGKPLELSLKVVLDDRSVETLSKVIAEKVADVLSSMLSKDTNSLQAQVGIRSKQEKEPFLLTNREAAKALRISERTLWSIKKTGKGPKPIYLGRIVRWNAQELRMWANAGCPDAAQDS